MLRFYIFLVLVFFQIYCVPESLNPVVAERAVMPSSNQERPSEELSFFAEEIAQNFPFEYASEQGIQFSSPEVLAEEKGLILTRRRWKQEEREGWGWHATCTIPCDAGVRGENRAVEFESFLFEEQTPWVSINGGFYDIDGSPMGVVISNYDVIQPFTGRGGTGIFTVDENGVQIISSSDFEPTVIHAVQSIDRIIMNGRTLPTRIEEFAARSAITISENAVSIVVVAADPSVLGSKTEIQLSAVSFMGMSLWAFADYLLATTDASEALNLDGGVSTQMAGQIGDVQFRIYGVNNTPNVITLFGTKD